MREWRVKGSRIRQRMWKMRLDLVKPDCHKSFSISFISFSLSHLIYEQRSPKHSWALSSALMWGFIHTLLPCSCPPCKAAVCVSLFVVCLQLDHKVLLNNPGSLSSKCCPVTLTMNLASSVSGYRPNPVYVIPGYAM